MGLDSCALQVEVTGVYAFVVSLFSSVNNVGERCWEKLPQITHLEGIEITQCLDL